MKSINLFSKLAKSNSQLQKVRGFFFSKKYEKTDKYAKAYSEKKDDNIEYEGEDDGIINEDLLDMFQSDSEITEGSK